MRNPPQPHTKLRERLCIEQKDVERAEREALDREIQEMEEAWLERTARRRAGEAAERSHDGDYTPSGLQGDCIRLNL
jgi:hypothetical protein